MADLTHDGIGSGHISDLEAIVSWLSGALWGNEKMSDVISALRRLADELEKNARD